MNIQEGCESLRLECAMRELGFIDWKDVVIGRAGIFFVKPIGWRPLSKLSDTLYGFLIAKPKDMIYMEEQQLFEIKPKMESAKRAIDYAIRISQSGSY